MSLSYTISKFLWHQSWFSPRLGRGIYKTICRHGDAPDHPFETDFYGLRYRGNLRNTIDFSVYYYGAFEKPLLFFLRDCLTAIHRSPTVFCDIGANIGQHSLFMSKMADHVHAFEPFGEVRQKLEQHIKLNEITNLSVHNVGLSNRDELLPFFAPTGRNQGIGSFDATTIAKGNRNIGNLALVNGDGYFRQQSITDIDLIKIDVEGFEKSALRGLRNTLINERPVVVCELTYGKELSITSMAELRSLFPEDYSFLTFDVRKADGSKARRKEAKARVTGDYHLIPFRLELQTGQDNIIACPDEKLDLLPRSYTA
jgi:FkbM family methyltransferase